MRTALNLLIFLTLASLVGGQSPDHEFNQAEGLFRLDNYAKARPLWVRAERRCRAQGDAVKAIWAHVSRLRGDSETVLSYPLVSREVARLLENPTVRNHPELRLRCLVVKGAADLSSKDPETSGRIWAEALELAQNLKDQFWIGRCSGELAVTAFLKGETAKAVELNARAFEIARKIRDLQGEIRQKSLEGVGLLEQQRYDEAIIRFDDALDFAKADPDVRFPLMAYMGKAQALAAQGKSAESTDLLRQAMQYVGGANMQVYKADLLLALANEAIQQKHDAEAEPLLLKATDAAQRAGMPRPYSDAQLRLAHLYAGRGDLIRAEKAIRKCISASRELVDMYFMPQNLAFAADIEVRLHRPEQADADYEEAEDQIESMLLNVPSASVKASLITTMDNVFRGHFALAMKERRIVEAFRILERARGRVIADNLRARPQSPEINADNSRSESLNRIQGELLRTKDVKVRAQLVDRLEHIEEESDLTELSRNRRRYSIHGKPVDLGSLQRVLRANEAVIEYAMDDPASECLVISREGVTHYALASRTRLEQQIASFLDATKAGRQDNSSSMLYEALFAPIRELSTKKSLIIVPDGKLGYIPFDSLIDSNGKYVIESHSLAYVPSATVLYLLRSVRRPEPPALLLAIGNSNRSSSTASSFSRAAHGLFDIEPPPQFRALPAVDVEVHEISAAIPGTKILVGGSASEAEFKANRLSNYRVIHIAAHGYADLKFPERSGVLLGFDRARREDGLLQVREIRDLQLNADLVTLSACDTGAGKLEGQNGVASVVQAFLFAGSRSVVASLWTADDIFTAELMSQFYARLADGRAVGEALTDAKLAMIHRLGQKAVPVLWAGFFVTGDPSATISMNHGSTQRSSIN
jgi:CHAT domain-containing protein